MIISSFFRKLLVIFLIISLSNTYAEEWTIKSNDDLSFALVNGEVTYGDNLAFFFRKSENCEKVWNTFSVYTYKKPKEINEILHKDIPIRLNGQDLTASVQDVRPFLMGYRVLFSLGHFTFKEYSNFLKEFYDEFKLYEIEIVNGKNFNASKYFDIKVNNWKLDNLIPSITEAQDICNQLLLSKS